jgi:hypothetical protein
VGICLKKGSLNRSVDKAMTSRDKQRLSWLGHVERLAEDNSVKKIKRCKPMSKRPIGRPKTRWEDDVLGDVRSLNVNWKKVVQDRDRWKEVVERARTLYRV